MGIHYVTFGQDHSHVINGKKIDKDCVAIFNAPSAGEGRAMAFDWFGRKFSFEYHEDEFDQSSMRYYPRGFVKVD